MHLSVRKGTFWSFSSRLQLILLLSSFPVFTQTVSTAGFSITDIGTLGGSYSLGYGINYSGEPGAGVIIRKGTNFVAAVWTNSPNF